MGSNEHRATAVHQAAAPIVGAVLAAEAGVDGDSTDWLSFGVVLRALMAEMEAEQAERELAAVLPPFARAQLATDLEGRREAVRIVGENGGRMGDKSIDRILAAEWSAEHVRRYGPVPAARTVRRWLRISAENGSLPSRPYLMDPPRGIAEDTSGAGSAAISKLAPGMEDVLLDEHVATRVADVGIPPADVPAIGDEVEIDGVRLLCIGRTVTGRTGLVEMDAPEGTRAAVRSLELGQRFSIVALR